MRWLLIFLTLCVALTVLRAAAAVLLIALAILFLRGAIFRTAETCTLLFLLLLTSLTSQHPIAVLMTFAYLGSLALVRQTPVSEEGNAEPNSKAHFHKDAGGKSLPTQHKLQRLSESEPKG